MRTWDELLMLLLVAPLGAGVAVGIGIYQAYLGKPLLSAIAFGVAVFGFMSHQYMISRGGE